jgi:hypothetical protein
MNRTIFFFVQDFSHCFLLNHVHGVIIEQHLTKRPFEIIPHSRSILNTSQPHIDDIYIYIYNPSQNKKTKKQKSHLKPSP